MVRVKNEEEFLYPAVKSIIDLVQEVVLIDNASSDGSPSIMERLRAEHPDTVALHVYPHEIRRVGRENWELSARDGDSPSLSANYYNWSLARCRRDYVLKWDGDMVALPSFSDALAAWRRDPRPVMVSNGVNVHPDRRHAIAARATDRESLLAALSVPGLPLWATSLTYDYPEPRLFPREGASYTSDLKWTQILSSPAVDAGPRNLFKAQSPSYLHMKFCKKDPLSNYTGDLAAAIGGNIAIGEPLRDEWAQVLRRWRIGP